MDLQRIVALIRRIVLQIVQDRRSIALIVVAPLIIMSLVGFSFIDKTNILNTIAPALIATFVLFLADFYLLDKFAFFGRSSHRSQ